MSVTRLSPFSLHSAVVRHVLQRRRNVETQVAESGAMHSWGISSSLVSVMLRWPLPHKERPKEEGRPHSS